MAVASGRADDPAGETKAVVAVAVQVVETRADEARADATNRARSPRR